MGGTMMPGISVAALAVPLLLACGGSGSGDAAGTGGSSAAAGNGSGGTSGSGGSAGGLGGSGGSGGTAIYGAVCAAAEALECWTGDCESNAQGTLDQAAARGCTTQALAAFQCYADHPPTCAASTGYSPDPQCDVALDAYLTCIQGTGTCSMGGLIEDCSVICGAIWGAVCSVNPGNSYADCHCRVGPKVGTQFTLPLVDKCDEALSQPFCAP